MNITITFKPADDEKGYTEEFTSIEEARDYLDKWELAIQATESVNNAVAVMKF